MTRVTTMEAAMATLLTSLVAAKSDQTTDTSIAQKRAEYFEDSYNTFIHKRNAHACIMSIVFIVLFPLGAISMHLPLRGVVRRVVTRIHAPIQLLGLAMMIAAMGVGIDIARNDLHYITPAKTHVVLGLLTTSTIILVQPLLGLLQHLHFKKTQKKSIFAYVHRWTGRITIILGWTNSALGFKLVGFDVVATHSLVRNFVIMGILGFIWFLLIGIDRFRKYSGKEGLGAMGPRWEKGIVFREDVDREEPKGDSEEH